MSTQSVLPIIGYFLAGWLLGWFTFMAPHILKDVHARRARQVASRTSAADSLRGRTESGPPEAAYAIIQ